MRRGTIRLDAAGSVTELSGRGRLKSPASTVRRKAIKRRVTVTFTRHYDAQDVAAWALANGVTMQSVMRALIQAGLGLPVSQLEPGEAKTRTCVEVSLPTETYTKLEYFARDRRLTVAKAALALVVRNHDRGKTK